jgi:hypothetical protein
MESISAWLMDGKNKIALNKVHLIVFLIIFFTHEKKIALGFVKQMRFSGN